MSLNLDSWPLKIAIVVALVAAREITRLITKPPEAGGQNEWVETIDSAAIAIGLVLCVIQPFLLQAFWIPTGSMENTMPPGDRLVASKLIYRLRDPQRGDIIVFKAPSAAVSPEEIARGEDTFIKRCVGLPGDIIWASHRRYFRRAAGQSTLVPLDEPYVKWSPEAGYADSYDMKIVNGIVYSREYAAPNAPDVWRVNGVPIADWEQQRIEAAPPEAIPDGCYLMLGDHRNNSKDGHVWGFIHRSAMLGKAIFVFWPPAKMGLADRLSRGVR